MISDGVLNGGHARALLSISDEAEQIQAAENVAHDLLSVRDTEKLVRRQHAKLRPVPGAAFRDPNVEAAEERLTKSLGTKVRIVSGRKKGMGRIEIDYFSEEELDRLFSLLVTRSH